MSQRDAFESGGFTLFERTIDFPALQRLRDFAGNSNKAGERLDAKRLAPIADLISRDGPAGQTASFLADRPSFAVRAILFDKVPGANWSLGWHQDRTINVAERIESPGYGPWTTKHGLLHVQPPQTVIEAMITLRIHLDDVAEDNGPLRVLPASHSLGRLSEAEIADLASNAGGFDCLASAGDIWAYRTAIVHSSRPVAEASLGRRVLQLDYSCSRLIAPLSWAMTI